MASLSLELGTPQATRVQDAIQRVLVEHDMVTADDSVMAEYVTVMIANRKGPEMIAEELRELMGSGLDARVVEQLWSEARVAIEGEAARPAPAAERERSASPPPRDTATRAHDRWEERSTRAPARGERDQAREKKGRAGRTPKEPTKPASISLLGRAGIPDPRAPPFVPSEPMPLPFMAMAAMAGAAAPSLFSRLDPMMPDNGPPVTTTAPAPPRDPAAFPTRPTDEALCRWSLACTNPLCPYSHPSPANAGKDGDAQALVLRADACEKGGACDDKECVLSHVSPAVAFITARGSAPPPGPAPCRFQQQCLNPACTYAHYSASGEPVPPPGKTSSTPCRFGLGCTRADCVYMHPTQRSATPCRYGDECTRRTYPRLTQPTAIFGIHGMGRRVPRQSACRALRTRTLRVSASSLAERHDTMVTL